MFVQQIKWNIEVYVDDILVKNKREDHHLDDLWETFETLHLYNMNLDPSKCVFGVSSGKLIGFMVSQRGVEANPKKFKPYWKWHLQRTSRRCRVWAKRLQPLTGSSLEQQTNAYLSSKHWRRPLSGPTNAREPSRRWRHTLRLPHYLVHPSPMKISPSTRPYPPWLSTQLLFGKKTTYSYLYTTLVEHLEAQKKGPLGEIGFCSNYSYPQTQAVFPSTHHSGPNQQTSMKNDKQSGRNQMIGFVGNRAKWVWSAVRSKNYD